jgi:hypothetical protein
MANADEIFDPVRVLCHSLAACCFMQWTKHSVVEPAATNLAPNLQGHLAVCMSAPRSPCRVHAMPRVIY